MHFRGAGIAHHRHDLARRGAAHDRIIDKHDPLALDRRRIGVVLQLHRIGAAFLRRLDKGPADIMVADDPEVEGNPRFFRIAKRRRYAGIGNRDDQVGIDVGLACQLAANGLAGVIDAASLDDRIRAREIDIFEDTEPRRDLLERHLAADAVLVDDQHLAGLKIAHDGGADDVEGAGFRRQKPGVVTLAKDQRPHPVRVAHPDQHVIGDADERIGAVDLLQRIDKPAGHISLMGAGHKMHDDLGVGG